MGSRRVEDAMLLADAELDGAASAQQSGPVDVPFRRDVEQGRAVVQALRQHDAGLAGIDLADDVRQAISARAMQRSPIPLYRRPLLGLAAMLVLAVGGSWWLLHADHEGGPQRAVGVPLPTTGEVGIRRKSAGQTDDARWVGLQVYRLSAAGELRPVQASIGRHDELLFAYTNLGPRPFRYLMVFALDAGGAVHWSYPAWRREDTDPAAIRIAEGRAGVELRELVRHELAAGPMTICGLFLRQPLTVSQIEASIRDLSQRGPLARTLSSIRPADSALHLLQVEVKH